MKSLFVEKDAPFADENICPECCWHKTSMCPLSVDYVGRLLFDLRHSNVGMGGKICYRFTLSADAEKSRQERIMMKLQENIAIDD